TDTLLDLGCGNGALTDRIFARCNGGVGVDVSEYLIDVARQNFERAPHRTYLVDHAANFVANCPDPMRFTKVLCYAAVPYLDDEDLLDMLTGLHQRFSRVTRVFLGNLPDENRIGESGFTALKESDRRDHDSPVGIWRSNAQIAQIAATAGWTPVILQMP